VRLRHLCDWLHLSNFVVAIRTVSLMTDVVCHFTKEISSKTRICFAKDIVEGEDDEQICFHIKRRRDPLQMRV
jgi:hypothetical protein